MMNRLHLLCGALLLAAFCGGYASAAPRSTVTVPPGALPVVSSVPYPAPYAVQIAGDPAVCADHGGWGAELVCHTAGQENGLALIWRWNNCRACPTIAGYKIYEVLNGTNQSVAAKMYATRRFVRSQPNGPDVTAANIDARPGGFMGACYVVTAYQGSNESPPSVPLCILPPPPGVSKDFALVHARSWVGIHTGKTGALDNLLQLHLFELIPIVSRTNSQSIDTPMVGFIHKTDKSFFGDSYYNLSSRAGMYFDLSVLGRRKVRSAILKLQVSQTIFDPAYQITTPFSCAETIGIATDYWWTYSGPLANVDFSQGTNPGVHLGPNVAIDVTSIVALWVMLGQANYGFILRNQDENLNAFTENSCLTQYVGATLTVATY